MTVSVANTNLTNTFDYWRTRTNELAFAMSTKALTTVGTAVGTASLNGTLSIGNTVANATINSTSFSFANSSTNFSMKMPTVAQVSNNQLYLNANGSWSTAQPPVSSLTVTGPSTTAVDSFLLSSYKSAEYLISVIDNIDDNYYSSKILVTHNATTAFITEYAALITNTAVGVFSATTNTTHVILNFTPVSTSANVTFTRITV